MKQDQQRVKNTLRNGLVGTISQFFVIIIGFILRAIFIKTLGQEYLGLNGLFTDILSIMSVTELGITSAITFALYKPVYENDTDSITSLMHLFRKAYLLVGTLILIVSIILLPFLQLFIKDFTLNIYDIRFYFMLFSINTVLSYYLGFNRIILFAKQRNYVVIWTDFSFKIILSVTQIVLLIVYKNFYYHIISMLVYTIITNFIIGRIAYKENPYLKDKPKKLNPELKQKLIHSLKYLSISTLIGVGVLGTDRIIISSLIGISILGIYSNYSMIIQQVTTLFTTLLNGVTASLGNLIAEGDQTKVLKVFKIYNFTYYLVASFTCISLYVLLTPFIRDIWLSNEYQMSQIIVTVIVFNSYMFFLRQPIWQFQNTAGIFKEYLPYSILEFFINLIISIFGALQFGIIGVFFGSFFAYIISWAGQSYKLHKHILKESVMLYYFQQIQFIVLMMIELGIVLLLTYFINPTNLYVSFGLKIIWVTFIPNTINYLIFRQTEEFLYIKSTLLSRFLNKSNS